MASNISAELWAILMGLKLAWANGYRKVILESDSAVGLALIKEIEPTSPYYNLVRQIKEWMSKKWDCQLKHVWREGNRSADFLAKAGIRDQNAEGILQEPPGALREILGADILGVSIPRIVPC